MMNSRIAQGGIQFQGNRYTLQQKHFIQRKASSVLHQDLDAVRKMSDDISDKRFNFLETLVNGYNEHNFYRAVDKCDDTKIVNNIFANILKPNELHFYIARRFANSFPTMQRIFEGANDKKKNLEFVRKIYREVFNGDVKEGNTLIPELLESKQAKTYVKNYKAIKPYLILNKNKSGAVKTLDYLFENGIYEKKHYEKLLNERNIKRLFNFKETEILNKETFLENYNKYSQPILKNLTKYNSLSDEILEKGADKPVLEILKSTNKNNYELRLNLLKAFSHKFNSFNINDKKDIYNAMAKFFDILDNDKNAKSFVKKSLPNIHFNISPQELNEIFANTSTKKLNIFKNNAWNIIKRTKGEERLVALNKDIENPFFNTSTGKRLEKEQIYYGFAESPSFVKKLSMKVVNFFNIIRDRLTSENKNYAKSLILDNAKIEPIVDTIKPVVEIVANEPGNSLVEKIADVAIQPLEEKVFEKTAKQITVENVISFVKNKLGEKTFAAQNDLYAKNATKMRLGMLPEIFASVADTRKADRAVGKRRINSSNKDVLDLYLKINGANKKFVNYLLKKRNVDGTRMFEIKDIIATIDKAEAKIAKEKELNPEYKTKDARKYYNHLYESKIEQYGKVKQQRKLKKIA